MKSKHVHEWRVETFDYEGMHFFCDGEGECDIPGGPSDEEIARRLNATERLEGITASNAAGIIAMIENNIYIPVHNALLAYAAALKEKHA